MSFNNPNHNDIIRSKPKDPLNMLKFYCKSYNNLAKYATSRKLNRKVTLDDYQIIFDEFVRDWAFNLIHRPKLIAIHKKIANPVWLFGCSMGINVQDSSREFVRTINPKFKKVFEYNYAAYIIRYNHFEAYKKYVRENRKQFKYRKRRRYLSPWEANPEKWAINNVSNNF